MINFFKRRFLKEAAGRVHGHFRELIEGREDNGWVRTSTPEIRGVLKECMGNFNPAVDSSDRKFDRDAVRLDQLIDVFCVLYDSDDAYADMFNRFVEKCNNGELVLEQGNRYLRVPVSERDDYEEELNKLGEKHNKFFDFDRFKI